MQPGPVYVQKLSLVNMQKLSLVDTAWTCLCAETVTCKDSANLSLVDTAWAYPHKETLTCQQKHEIFVNMQKH